MGRRVAVAVTALLLIAASAAAVYGHRRRSEADARARLAVLEELAGAARRHALRESWRLLVEPDAPVGPPSGVLPLSLLDGDELESLWAWLPDPEDVAALEFVREQAVAVKAGRDPALAKAIEALRTARAARFEPAEQDALDRAQLEGAGDERELAWRRAHEHDARLAPLVRDVARARIAWRDSEPLARRDPDPVALALREEVTAALAPAPGEALVNPWDAEAADPALAARLAVLLPAETSVRRARDVLPLLGAAGRSAGLLVREGEGGGFSSYATFAVDPPHDVRVVLAPGAGIPAHWSSLHEMGHAAQALLVPEGARPFLRRPLDAVGESVAKVAERLAYAPEWLRLQGVPEPDIAALRAWEEASERARMRDILADVAFEELLHAEPESDLDAAWAGLRARLAGERAPVAQAWAGERSAALEPGRREHYLLARCAQAAIYRRLRALPGGLLGDAARDVLRSGVFGPAGGVPYEAWFERAAGVPPSCDAWLQDVAGASAARASTSSGMDR